MVTFGKTPHEVLTLTITPPTPVSCSFVVPQTKGTAAESTCVPSTSNLHFCDQKLVTTSTELPLWSTTYRGIGLPSIRPLHLARSPMAGGLRLPVHRREDRPPQLPCRGRFNAAHATDGTTDLAARSLDALLDELDWRHAT